MFKKELLSCRLFYEFYYKNNLFLNNFFETLYKYIVDIMANKHHTLLTLLDFGANLVLN